MIAKNCFTIALSPFPFLLFFLLISIWYEIFLIPAIIFLAIQIFFLYFFRDVGRRIGDGIISPADGRVMEIDGNRASIFMSIFDMHVNLAPYDGRIVKMVYRRGEHNPAYGDVAKNERMEIYMESSIGSIVIIQIAGIFARRIVPYVGEGDYVKKGEKIGIIRFGSRVDIVIPPPYKFVIKEGEKIKAGTKIANL